MATTTNENAAGSAKPPSVQMRHVDLKKDHVSEAQRKHMEMMNKKLLDHVKDTKRLGKKNALVGVVCGAAVIGIFSYSIYAVGRESFLDNFDDPNKPKDL